MQNIRKIVSRNPYTGILLKELPFTNDKELNTQLIKAHNGFLKNKSITITERSTKLQNIMKILNQENYLKKYAEIITNETGKPIRESIGEIKKCVGYCQYYSENLELFLKDENIQTEAKKSYIRLEPLGAIFIILPFNFPFWLAFKSAIPALCVGNSILCRFADSSPDVGLAVEEVMKSAGFNDYEFQNIYSSIEQTEKILSNDLVKGVSFTGSSIAGSTIASLAGKHLKKSVMELGGCDPFIVLEDADVDLAVDCAIKSRLLMCGQVCFSGKRYFISDKIYDEFANKLKKRLEMLKIGNPADDSTEIGPLARIDLLEKLEYQIEKAVSQGAKILYGGKRLNVSSGYFYSPTIVEVNMDNILCQEEVFGPVFSLIKFENEKNVIEMANKTSYGLGGSVYTKDIAKGEDFAKKIEAGQCFVNSFVKSDARMPSGGIKNSGFGRECSKLALYEFANIKSVWIN